MIFWIIATIALIIQETVFTSVVFSISLPIRNNLFILTSIFFISTSIQVLIFHRLGKRVQEKGKNILIIHFVRAYLSNVESFVGRRGCKFFLLIMSASIFPPSLTAFISSWFKLSFPQKFLYILSGDILWYAITWSIVLGVFRIVGNPHFVSLYTALVAFIYVILQRIISKKIVEN